MVRIAFFLIAAYMAVLVPAWAYASSQDTVEHAQSGMVLIPGGPFLMGTPDATPAGKEERPQHRVTVSPFFIDSREVTNEQYASFLNSVGSGDDFEKQRMNWVVIRNDLTTAARREWWPTEIEMRDKGYAAVRGAEKLPVLSLSWYGADEYCRWAGKRLPTEAEWEKAARGRLEGKEFPWGDAMPTDGVIYRRSWLNNAFPAPVEEVGNYYPNGYGLYDMAGNVAEWCADWYDPDYYGKRPSDDPRGPEKGDSKVVRGGSWASLVQSVRVAFRNFSFPDRLNSGVGVRCVKDAERK